MSQSIKFCCSGLSRPILQHKSSPSSSSSSSSSCMFGRRMEVGGGGFPIINLSLVMKEECSRKRASVVSNHNPRRTFLPCATPLKRSNIVDEGGNTNANANTNTNTITITITSGWSKNYNPDPLEVMFVGALSKCCMLFFKLIPDAFDNPPEVNAELVSRLVYFDLHDPIDGLKVLLDVSRAWRKMLNLSSGDELYDALTVDDYGESYIRKARMEVPTYKGLHYYIKKCCSRMTTRLSILRLLANLNDPNEGLQVMLRALDIWETRFTLNDSEGYLQKEIFAILDLSQRLRILASNINDKHDEAKSRITHVVEILKPMIDNFERSKDPVKATSKALRRFCPSRNDISYPVIWVVANLNLADLSCLLY